jgi:hypothetical protein
VPLRTYHHPVDSFLIGPEQLRWADDFAQTAIRRAVAEGKEIKNPKGRAKSIRVHKLACIAFAGLYGFVDQWDRHAKISIWKPDVDFEFAGHRVRLVVASANEGWNFGSTLQERVWENDYDRGHHTGYVLCAWFPPYVDFVGWLPRDQLALSKERSWYRMQEATVWPMSTMPGLKKGTPWART